MLVTLYPYTVRVVRLQALRKQLAGDLAPGDWQEVAHALGVSSPTAYSPNPPDDGLVSGDRGDDGGSLSPAARPDGSGSSAAAAAVNRARLVRATARPTSSAAAARASPGGWLRGGGGVSSVPTSRVSTAGHPAEV